MKNTRDSDDAVCAVDPNEDSNGTPCQVRRKIEEYLERRRSKDELGELAEAGVE